jgi:hypothetical protein
VQLDRLVQLEILVPLAQPEQQVLQVQQGIRVRLVPRVQQVLKVQLDQQDLQVQQEIKD